MMTTGCNSSRTEIKQYQAIEIILMNHPKLMDYLFAKAKPELKCSAEILLKNARGYSSSEQILIKIALDFWNATGHVYLNEILESLDTDNFIKVVKGIIHLKTQ